MECACLYWISSQAFLCWRCSLKSDWVALVLFIFNAYPWWDAPVVPSKEGPQLIERCVSGHLHCSVFSNKIPPAIIHYIFVGTKHQTIDDQRSCFVSLELFVSHVQHLCVQWHRMRVSHQLFVCLSLEGSLIGQQCHPPNLKDKTV